MSNDTTTRRMPTVSAEDIIRNKRAGLANLTRKRAIGFASPADLERIAELQDDITRLEHEETARKYGASS